MTFGLKPHQAQEAGGILLQIARDWRELIAGSEGYLTDATRRGLFRQNVAWGEMVCWICWTKVALTEDMLTCGWMLR